MLPRALVLILLAMNLGVALWAGLRPAALPAPLVAASEPGVPTIRLLSEVDPNLAAPSAAEPDGPPLAIPPAPQRQCLQVGPLLTQIDLRRVVAALSPAAQRIQYRESRALIRRGYRVFLPSPGSREAALTLARQLSARGLRDYYVVTAGDEQNTISLGLYRDESNAQRRRDEVRALGIEPRLEPRNEELPQYWIDLEVLLDSDWRSALGGYVGIGSQEIPCAAETGPEQETIGPL